MTPTQTWNANSLELQLWQGPCSVLAQNRPLPFTLQAPEPAKILNGLDIARQETFEKYTKLAGLACPDSGAVAFGCTRQHVALPLLKVTADHRSEKTCVRLLHMPASVG